MYRAFIEQVCACTDHVFRLTTLARAIVSKHCGQETSEASEKEAFCNPTGCTPCTFPIFGVTRTRLSWRGLAVDLFEIQERFQTSRPLGEIQAWQWRRQPRSAVPGVHGGGGGCVPSAKFYPRVDLLEKEKMFQRKEERGGRHVTFVVNLYFEVNMVRIQNANDRSESWVSCKSTPPRIYDDQESLE